MAYAGPDEEPGLFVETFWAALHGLITLTRVGRLPADRIPSRITLLVNRFVAQPPEHRSRHDQHSSVDR